MNKFIKEGITAGFEFIVLEPKDAINNASIGFDKEDGRLVYEVEKILKCLEEDMDPRDAVDWFYYNTIETTHMKGGPFFYDENEENYLTHHKKHVKL